MTSDLDKAVDALVEEYYKEIEQSPEVANMVNESVDAWKDESTNADDIIRSMAVGDVIVNVLANRFLETYDEACKSSMMTNIIEPMRIVALIKALQKATGAALIRQYAAVIEDGNEDTAERRLHLISGAADALRIYAQAALKVKISSIAMLVDTSFKGEIL